MAEDNGQDHGVDLSGLGSFDFAPSWAAGDKVVAATSGSGFGDRGEDRSPYREKRTPSRHDGQKPSGPRPGRDRDDRPRRKFGDAHDGEHDRARKPFGRGDRRGFVKREYIQPLDAEVRILPGQKELGGIIRKIQTGFAAYPLKQIAWFFLDHPEACHVKVTPKDPEIKFHVCKACGHSCFTDEALDAHILSTHLGDYYTAEETDVEPPSGQFACVVKCGITGTFMGPPNLHDTGARIREMAQRLGMDEASYRARLVTLHDQEAVEAWRRDATKKVFYRLKVDAAAASPLAEDGQSAAEVPAQPLLERDQAELAFRRDIMPQLKSLSKSSDMPLDKALKSQDLPYLYAVRGAIARERRFPASLFFALRGAFHHRKMEFFRANEQHGQEFVCAVKFSPLDVAHAIPELVAVVKFVEEHPLCHVNELSPEMKGHLGWLVEKGHIVQYFNGFLALPEAHPKFSSRPPRKGVAAASGVEAPANVPEAPSSADPAAEAAPAAESVPVAESVSAAETVPVAEAAPAEDVKIEEEKKEVPNEVADQLAE